MSVLDESHSFSAQSGFVGRYSFGKRVREIPWSVDFSERDASFLSDLPNIVHFSLNVFCLIVKDRIVDEL